MPASQGPYSAILRDLSALMVACSGALRLTIVTDSPATATINEARSRRVPA